MAIGKGFFGQVAGRDRATCPLTKPCNLAAGTSGSCSSVRAVGMTVRSACHVDKLNLVRYPEHLSLRQSRIRKGIRPLTRRNDTPEGTATRMTWPCDMPRQHCSTTVSQIRPSRSCRHRTDRTTELCERRPSRARAETSG